MVELIPFDQKYASLILSWAESENDLFYWAAREDFPLDDVSVFPSWHADPDIEAWLIKDQDQVIGYGELWCEEEEPWAEMARLIIAPEVRGQGRGKQLVLALQEVLHQNQIFDEFHVRVMASNKRALACYQSAGFVPLTDEEQKKLNSSERIEYIWLKKNSEYPQS